jgi:photosystem II stability/assembly factor-like uncharacterized protein
MTPIQGLRRTAAGLAAVLWLALPAWAQTPPTQAANPPPAAEAPPATQANAATPAADAPAEAEPSADAGAPVDAAASEATATDTVAADTAATAPATDPGGADAAPAVPEKAETARLAGSQALVLDFAESSARAVAVGERGHILVSESRTDWRQVADVPTRANLNAVTAVGDKLWAVGHDGTILHSTDGGLTWLLQRSDPWRPSADDEEFNPRRGVPLLDVLMLDEQRGFAIGAYSLLLRTEDGGAHWEEVDVLGTGTAAAGAADASDAATADAAAAAAETGGEANDESWTFNQADLELEEESDPHLNAIARTGDGSIFIVAERGAAFRSRDEGKTWERLQLPYEGSMFGVIGYEGQRLLAFGMRGNAFESNDLGATWKRVDTGVELSLMGGAALPEGGAALVGANGVVLIRPTAEAPVTRHTFQTRALETPVLSGVLVQSTSALVVGGEKGVGTFQAQAQ